MTVVPIVTATGQVLAKAVINNSANPYAFKMTFQPSQVGVQWYYNTKAWMRTDIFSKMMAWCVMFYCHKQQHILVGTAMHDEDFPFGNLLAVSTCFF